MGGQVIDFSMPDSAFRALLKRFSQKSRARKFALFESLIRPSPDDRVLDIGASGEVFLQYTFEDFYRFPDQIVAGGYEFHEIEAARRHYPRPRYTVFDGCRLPFGDQSFDVVFSNAVIEHILGDGRQESFAREVMRVGKSWFVTTPNYWYPFESHYHLPLIQFMPEAMQRHYNCLLGTHIPKGTVQELNLLSAQGLQRLFPPGRVAKIRVTFWPETLAVYYRDPARPAPSETAAKRGV